MRAIKFAVCGIKSNSFRVNTSVDGTYCLGNIFDTVNEGAIHIVDCVPVLLASAASRWECGI